MDEKPRIDLPDPFGLGGVEFQTPDERLTPQKMGALEQHLERAGWLNLQEGQVLLAIIHTQAERIKDYKDDYHINRETLRSFLSEDENVKYPTTLDKIQFLGAGHTQDAEWIEKHYIPLIAAITEVVWGYDNTELLTIGQYGQDLLRVAARMREERDQLKERLKGLEAERDHLFDRFMRLDGELEEVCDMLNPEWRGKFTLKELVQENIGSRYYFIARVAELHVAINPDGSLTEHQQFVETARDGAHALDKLAEIDSELAERDQLLLTFRTMEASLGTLDHSEAVEECDLAASVEKKVFALRRELAKARADTERLDWLDGSEGSYQAVMHHISRGKGSVNFRQAIDAARLAQKPEVKR